MKHSFIATFFSHYDAMQFARALQSRGIPAQLMPVPRRVSSSCGACVRFDTDKDVAALAQAGVESILRLGDDEDYLPVYAAE